MRLLSFILTLASAQDVFKAETVIVNLLCIKSLALHDLAIFVILFSSKFVKFHLVIVYLKKIKNEFVQECFMRLIRF